MSAPQTAPVPAPVSPVVLLRTLGTVALVCGLLLVITYQATLPAITANKKRAVERAVLAVIPGAVTSRELIAARDGIRAPNETVVDGIRVYAAYDGGGRLRGVAAEGAARGYADVVRLLYGYDLDCQCIVGIKVIQTKETPGIGDRISTDKAFLRNFDALEARLNAEGTALANAIVTVRHGTKSKAWEIDAISGATVTSRAVGKALNDSAQRLAPRVVPHAAALKEKPS
jgi:electron transport complex protein RnfG